MSLEFGGKKNRILEEAEGRRQKAVDQSSKFNGKSGALIKIKISENLDMEEDELK